MLRKITTPFHNPNPTALSTFFNPTTKTTQTLQRSLLSTFPPNSNGQINALFETNFRAFDSLLSECLNQRALRQGQTLHAQLIKTSHSPPQYLANRLAFFYTKCESLGDARKLLGEMPITNVVSWTAVISAYVRKGLDSEALSLFVRMMRSETEPNEYTFASVLTSCTGSSGLSVGMQIHSLVLKRNLESHVFVGSSLLDMYAKGGRITDARVVFEGLLERDVVSCTAMVSGYAQLDLDEEALELFRRLVSEGMVPNHVTYSSLLTALSGLAALDLGRQVHAHFVRLEVPLYVVLQNSLIDMYSKCGNLDYSRRIFDGMSERTVISWNAMLVGYSKHGMGREVIELFALMTRENRVKPVSVTFLAVLSGCSHGGMEDKGLRIFYEMEKGRYGPDLPEMVHYACVIDLLGRAGRTDEAYVFIKKMPFEATAAMWGSLLGACRVHSDIDIGEIAGQRLLQIEPENAGNYVILSNLYACTGRWEDVTSVRELMKENVVKKEPGRSWIEVDQVLHTFHASERSHPQRDEVKAKAKELSIEFKKVGYVPNMSCVLFDVDEETKERILLNHSEKLALAFGLMATKDGMPIRVIKNLRICVDCHDFAKIFSKVCGREVSLRDKTRFHRIVDGICSCGDYW